MKHKKTIVLLVGNALLLLLIGICLFRIGHYDGLLRSQQAAKAWAGQSEERFAQASVFFPAASPENPETLRSFEQGIEKKLIDAGIEPKEQGQHWVSAYSVQSTLMVEGDRNRAEATVIGVGGDFFLFHPYLLASGAYLDPDDLMKDRVVLDYDLAWKLFGGASLEGMSVKIGDKPYYVAGVIHRETDKFTERAYSGEPVLYMDYSTLASLQEGLGLTSYEIAMPNPIGGFVESYLKEGFQNSKAVVLENSNRYRFSKILRLFTHFGERSIADSGVAFPHWENAARLSEDYIARLYLIIALLAAFPLICLGILLIRLLRLLSLRMKALRFASFDAWDDRYARREKRQQKRLTKREKKEQGKQNQETKLSKRIRFRKKETAREAEQPLSPLETIQKEIAVDVDSIIQEILNESQTKQ